MDEIFRRSISNGFSEFAGLTVDASIPVPEHIVNEIIKSALLGNKTITDCRVSISRGNQVSVNLKTPLWLLPIHLKLRLENSVMFTGSPQVRAILENNVLIGKLGAFFKVFPEGINLDRDQIVVDIKSFLPSREYDQILDLIKSVAIQTGVGKLILNVNVEVKES